MHRPSLAALSLAALLLAPVVARGAAEETVTCKDGTTSKGGRGACRGHGGVDKKAAKAAAKDAREAEKEGRKEAKEAAKERKKEAKEDRQEARKRANEAGAPAAPAAVAAETVTCKDGTTSKAGRGACRGHGGVDRGAATAARPPPAAAAPAPTPTPTPAAPPPAPPVRAAPPALPAPAQAPSRGETNARNTDPTGAIARCKDGTYSHAKGHIGACSRHGGVAEWLDGTKK